MCKYENMKMRKYENEVRKNEIGSNGRNYAAPIHRGVFLWVYPERSVPRLGGSKDLCCFSKARYSVSQKILWNKLACVS